MRRANGRGSWLTTLRRGNLDVLADQLDSDVGQPQYMDFFNKLRFSVTPRSDLSAGFLGLDDKISLNDAGIAAATADYSDHYYWLTLSRNGDAGLESNLTISSAKLVRTRSGSIDDPARVVGTLADTSTFDRLNPVNTTLRSSALASPSVSLSQYTSGGAPTNSPPP